MTYGDWHGRFTVLALLVFTLVGLGRASLAQADDWPQWLGPARDGVWRESGIRTDLPKELPVLWRAEVALGYSGPAVANGRVFLTDYLSKSGDFTNNPSGREKLEGQERILCFDARTGKQLWKQEYAREYYLSYPNGPRCTPTVDGDRVYALGAEGDLLCLAAATGNVIWSKSLTKEYGVEAPMWGFAAHPLVEGDLLYCIVGGPGSVAVAFDKLTGKEVWKALSAVSAGYCPPTMIEHAGVKQLLIWHPQALNSLNPKTGEVYWSVPLEPGYGMSVTAPKKSGSHLFASAIGNAAALLKLDDTRPAAEVLWRGNPKNALYSCNTTPHLADGMIYGCDCQLGAMMGVRLEDGERVWQTFAPTTGTERRASHGTAFMVRHEDRYFVMSETGDLIVTKLSPAGYQELGRSPLLKPTSECFGRSVVWSHPAFANKCIFARNDKELVCVDLAARK